MRKQFNIGLVLGFVLMTASCVDLYEFELEDRDGAVVVESFISNQSFADTYLYPSDGRFFSVVLSRTTEVKNARPEFIKFATVMLHDDEGNTWSYTEEPDEPGHYYLYDAFFEAIFNTEYQLEIIMPEGEVITSDWQKMEQVDTHMGEVEINEKILEKYEYRDDERIIKSSQGIGISVKPEDQVDDQPVFYKWEFDPLWIFDAPYLSAPNMDRSRCWVRNQDYLHGYELFEALPGRNSRNELFFIETVGNERVYKYFSVLITQQVLSEDYFNFWREMKEQSSRSGLFEEPPYSLKSNLHSSDNDTNVVGYFGVITESAIRWEFDASLLSYPVENDLVEECDANICMDGPCPPPSCSDCTAYIWGNTTESAPHWWF